jgi:hypothetical protein
MSAMNSYPSAIRFKILALAFAETSTIPMK